MVDVSSLIMTYGYIGVFLASFIGSASIIFPIPYLILFYYIGASRILDPTIVSLSGGLGATFGEFILYVVGLGGRKIISENTIKNVEFFKRALDRYGPIIIFIFAATPLPDDIIYPTLGIMKYDVSKTFLACFFGKTLLTAFVVFSGYYSYEYIRFMLGGNDILSSVVITVLAIVFTIVVIKTDWSKIFRMGVER